MKITLDPNEVWDYFFLCSERAGMVMEKIAESPEYGVEIYLTSDSDNELPVIMVLTDNEIARYEVTVSKVDCYNTVMDLYDEYLVGSAAEVLSGSKAQDDEIEERESEIDDVVELLIEELVPNISEMSADRVKVREGIKDLVCEYLYVSHGISVYRPMYLENDKGEDEFFEYPYPEMELGN